MCEYLCWCLCESLYVFVSAREHRWGQDWLKGANNKQQCE